MSRNFELLREVEKEHEQFRAAVGSAPMPTTAMSPKGDSAFPRNTPRVQEEMLKLVQRLFLSGAADAPRRVVFCTIDEGSESPWLCARAGEILASQVSVPVCVVDAKFRAPSLHQCFDGELRAVRAVSPTDTCRKLAEQVSPNLWLASCEALGANGNGAPNAESLRSRLGELRSQFDYLLIDAPAVTPYGDAALLGQLSDGVVLVLEANSTRRAAAKRGKEVLEAANVRLLGTVLNNRTFPIPERLYRKL
jgi:succinoglycan biosynthesis transport protein ExoP